MATWGLMLKPTAPGRCANPVHHAPPYAYVDHHHMLPHSWGGPTEVYNLLPLCQSCHHAIHWLLDEFVNGITTLDVTGVAVVG
jgi:predicted restriction endonuclease